MARLLSRFGLFRDLGPFLKPLGRYKLWLAAGFILSLATLAGSIGLLALSGWFITATAIAGLASGAALAFDFFSPGASIRGFAILRTAARYGERVVTHEATFRLLADLRLWLFEKAIPLAPTRLGGFKAGDLLSRLTADIDALDGLYLRVLAPAGIFAVAVITGCALMALVNIEIALIAAGGLLLCGIVLPPLFALAGRRPGERMTGTMASLRETAVEGVQGVAELAAYGAAARQRAALGHASSMLAHQQQRMAHLTGLGAALTGLAGNLALWGALFIGAAAVSAGTLTPPLLALLAFGLMALFEAAAPMPLAFQMLGKMRAAARRLTALASLTPATSAPAHPQPLPAGNRLAFSGVTFTHTGAARPALAQIDLVLEPGERLAIIGPSGAGKSTLGDLALRFRDPDAGQVTLGGTDLRLLDPDAVLTRFAVVSQRTQLFAASLRDNLLIARPGASDEELWQALADAQLEEWIRDLPHGLNTVLGEGESGLSGGQARRLAVTRALLKNAPILILDEPTTGLDAETENRLAAALDRLMAGRSVLYITHQMKRLELMDQIIVLKDGHIAERGSPADLMAADGHYARLKQA